MTQPKKIIGVVIISFIGSLLGAHMATFGGVICWHILWVADCLERGSTASVVAGSALGGLVGAILGGFLFFSTDD